MGLPAGRRGRGRADRAGLAVQLSTGWGRLEQEFYPRTALTEALRREHRGGAVLWMDDALSYLTDQNQPEVLTNGW